MNSDYQRVLDKAQELHDMLEALANKWQGQGKTADAERLIGVWGSIESALGVEPERELPYDNDPAWNAVIAKSLPQLDRLAAEAVLEHEERPARRRKKNEPPPDDTPEGVPA